METIRVILKHVKAKKLLQDLEELDLIQLEVEEGYLSKNASSRVTDLKDMLITPISDEQSHQQLQELRNEWEREI